ncbi:MAG: hypothetical protein SGI73_13270 [Chloroflexota bacterium]|nr:hypothetical protein [Chloroflexota bacterium]
MNHAPIVLMLYNFRHRDNAAQRGGMTNSTKNWLIGFGIGAGIAALLVLWFAPRTGGAFIAAAKRGYVEARSAAQIAAEARRVELEAELQRMQGKR